MPYFRQAAKPKLSAPPANPALNQGTPNTAANAWPVEVTDGKDTLGTSDNPLVVQEASSGAAAAQTSSDELARIRRIEEAQLMLELAPTRRGSRERYAGRDHSLTTHFRGVR